MNVKNYFTLAGIVGILYGLFFFLMPSKAHEVYESSEIMNDMTINLLKFLGASIFASGLMVFMARNAHMSIARKAILIYLAVSFALFFYLNIMGVVNGNAGNMAYVDIVISVLFAGSAIYFLTKEKTAE